MSRPKLPAELLAGLTPIDLFPAPAMLARAMGYGAEQDARYVALYYQAARAHYTDGRHRATGYWPPYLQLVQSWRLSSWLRRGGFDLGSDDVHPTHYLLLDQDAPALWVGSVEAVDRALAAQWPPAPADAPTGPLRLSREALEQLLAEHYQRREAYIPTQRAALAEFAAWCVAHAGDAQWLDAIAANL